MRVLRQAQPEGPKKIQDRAVPKTPSAQGATISTEGCIYMGSGGQLETERANGNQLILVLNQFELASSSSDLSALLP